MTVSQVLTGASLSTNWNLAQKDAFALAVSQAMGDVVDPEDISDVTVTSVSRPSSFKSRERRLQQTSVEVNYRIYYDINAVNELLPPGSGATGNDAALAFLESKLKAAVTPPAGGGLSVFTQDLQKSSPSFATTVSAATVDVTAGPVTPYQDDEVPPSLAPTTPVQESSSGTVEDKSQLFGTIGIILGVILFVVILGTYMWIRKDFQKSSTLKNGIGGENAAGGVLMSVPDDTVGENPLYTSGSPGRRQSGLVSDSSSPAPKRISVQNVVPRKPGEPPVPGAHRSAPPPPPMPPPASVLADAAAAPTAETPETEPALAVAVPVEASKAGESKVVPPPPGPPPGAAEAGAARQFAPLRAPPPPARASLAVEMSGGRLIVPGTPAADPTSQPIIPDPNQSNDAL